MTYKIQKNFSIQTYSFLEIKPRQSLKKKRTKVNVSLENQYVHIFKELATEMSLNIVQALRKLERCQAKRPADNCGNHAEVCRPMTCIQFAIQSNGSILHKIARLPLNFQLLVILMLYMYVVLLKPEKINIFSIP